MSSEMDGTKAGEYAKASETGNVEVVSRLELTWPPTSTLRSSGTFEPTTIRSIVPLPCPDGMTSPARWCNPVGPTVRELELKLYCSHRATLEAAQATGGKARRLKAIRGEYRRKAMIAIEGSTG
jgi:hypothetical protein